MHKENAAKAVELARAWVEANEELKVADMALKAATATQTAVFNKLDAAKKHLHTHLPHGASRPRTLVNVPGVKGLVMVEAGGIRILESDEMIGFEG